MGYIQRWVKGTWEWKDGIYIYIQQWVKGTWEWKDGIYTAMGERDLGMERWDIYSDG